MNNKARNLIQSVLAISLMIGGSVAHAKLVGNPGFEDKELPWIIDGVAFVDSDTKHSGKKGLKIRANDDQRKGSARQSFELLLTEDYALDFFLMGSASAISALKITFGGTPFSALPGAQIDAELGANNLPTGWDYYSAVITGSTGGVLLFAFDADTGSSEVALDDVSLTCIPVPGTGNCDNGGGNQVPEPGSLLLVGAALSALAVYRRRSKTVV